MDLVSENLIEKNNINISIPEEKLWALAASLSTTGLTALLEEVAKISASTFGADRVGIFLPCSNGTHLDLGIAWGLDAAEIPSRIAFGKGLVGKVAINQNLEISVSQYSSDPSGFCSSVAIPLHTQSHLVAVIELDSLDKVQFLGIDSSITAQFATSFASIIEHARIFEAEKQARKDAEMARSRLTFVAEVSSLLATSLDYTSALTNLAHLAVPQLGDFCFIDLVTPDGPEGELNSLIWVGPNISTSEDNLPNVLTKDQKKSFSFDLTPLSLEAFHSKKARLYDFYPDVSKLLGSLTKLVFPSLSEQTNSINMAGSVISVPLDARGRVLGVLNFITLDHYSKRRYQEQDLSFFQDLAHRAGLAIDRARLFEERSRVAQVLQDSLLPALPPEIPGLEISSRYRAAWTESVVGGDFYDVFATDSQTWSIVIGDVCGKGVEAATLTALARYTLRAAAMQSKEPSRILEQLNQAILKDDSKGRFCTAIFAQVKPGKSYSQVRVSCGGHPPPAILRKDKTVEFIDCTGSLLGVFSKAELNDIVVDLHPGDFIVFYTDGVIEARREKEVFGEKRLGNLLQNLPNPTSSSIAIAIEEEVLDWQNNVALDDVAIVVLGQPE